MSMICSHGCFDVFVHGGGGFFGVPCALATELARTTAATTIQMRLIYRA